MKILIACEFSGIVREAFKARGHDAWSCDLLPTEIPGRHLIMDNDMHLKDTVYGGEWDMLIAHPPCTYLANSGVRWLNIVGGKITNKDRWQSCFEASHFFKMLLDAPISRVCIENPIPHKYASLPKYTQIVQPWMFGHGETKATCLWLKNLPILTPTDVVAGRTARVHKMTPGPNRWKERSRTLPGLSAAMADQWGQPELINQTA